MVRKNTKSRCMYVHRGGGWGGIKVLVAFYSYHASQTYLTRNIDLGLSFVFQTDQQQTQTTH